MSEKELKRAYDALVSFYWDIPFWRIPRRFVRQGVYGMRLITFEEFKRMG